MDEMTYTVTLTAKELAFRERAREAGIPAIVVSMYAGALQRLVDKERQWVGLTDEEMEGLYESATYMDKTDCIHLLTLAADKLKEKNGG
jgi:hypothetical protein